MDEAYLLFRLHQLIHHRQSDLLHNLVLLHPLPEQMDMYAEERQEQVVVEVLPVDYCN